MHGVTMKIWK